MKTHSSDIDRIEIRLVQNVIDAEAPELEDNDVQKMVVIPKLVQALKAALGAQLSGPKLRGAALHLEMDSGGDPLARKAETLNEELKLAETELKRNAAREMPLPHSIAITNKLHVPVLRAASVASTKYKLEVVVRGKDEAYVVPVLDAADFTEPDAADANQRTDTFMIVGLRRDDAHGHRIMVTDHDLPVHLPKDDPRWTWAKIHDALEKPTWLEGTICRLCKGTPWEPAQNARLVAQEVSEPRAA